MRYVHVIGIGPAKHARGLGVVPGWELRSWDLGRLEEMLRARSLGHEPRGPGRARRWRDSTEQVSLSPAQRGVVTGGLFAPRDDPKGSSAAGSARSISSICVASTARSPQRRALGRTRMTQPRMPAVYINHGGGPLPLLGQQPEVSSFLKGSKAKAPSLGSAASRQPRLLMLALLALGGTPALEERPWRSVPCGRLGPEHQPRPKSPIPLRFTTQERLRCHTATTAFGGHSHHITLGNFNTDCERRREA
jgi:hypothetical protein